MIGAVLAWAQRSVAMPLAAVGAPVHAGSFEPTAEDVLAAGLDDTGADEHAQRAEAGVAHPGGVAGEVANRGVAVDEDELEQVGEGVQMLADVVRSTI